MFILVQILLILKLIYGLNVDSLVQKANIYYQQPLQNSIAHEYNLNDIEILPSKNNLKIIIHGFLGNRCHNSIRPIGHAYETQGYDNVFLADWEDAAKLDYSSSRKLVGKVGIFFGQLLENFIKKHEIALSEIHVIGHSLGAHIAGELGRYFNGSLGRVTGVDPALPLFLPNSPDSLHSNAAVFVDVIHTDYPIFGDATPRGTVDFYPNYGHTPQRGCSDGDVLTARKLLFEAYSCSHNRAVTLYAESIVSPYSFPAIPCTLKAIRMQKYSGCLVRFSQMNLSKDALANAIAENDTNTVVYMGESVSKSASGIYFLETYDAPPYGIGKYTQIH